jgi:hypothetical protein
MTIDLTTYRDIKTALCCKIVVPDYGTMLFTDYTKSINLDDGSYTSLGSLLSVSEATSDLKALNSEVTITISGIPTANISMVMNNKVKGSKISVRRVIMETTTDTILAIPGNPVGRFYGIINNFSVAETWGGLDSTTTISFMCKSMVGLMQYKKAGRRTNPLDQKKFYPSDTSMDRVPSLAGAKMNFGAR